MQAADFDVVVPEEEKEGMSSKTASKYSGILQRYCNLLHLLLTACC